MLNHWYDFLVFYEVKEGNPNGDPDAGNKPRMDPETNYGYVTDVCFKRKIRDYVDLKQEGAPGYNILIKNDMAFNTKFTAAYDALELEKKQEGKNRNDVEKAKAYMCQNYYDVRMFGAVMDTGDDRCGSVRGPVQFSFADSLSPIHPQNKTITQKGRPREEDFKSNDSGMGRKQFIPYGLYCVEGHIMAPVANKTTNISEEDVELLWDAIINMFRLNYSAARGKQNILKLFVFKHDNIWGNALPKELFDKITVVCPDYPPRCFEDYEIKIDREMPKGVELIEML